MSKMLHPDDGIVISRKWIEGEITRLSNLRPDVISLPPKEYAQLHLLRHILHFHSQPLKPLLEVDDKLVSIAYEANNHSRQMINKYVPKDQQEINYGKVNRRAKFLSENYADNNELKIVQSTKNTQP